MKRTMTHTKSALWAFVSFIGTIACHGTITIGYPGLKTLIEKSDAIVILRTDGSANDAQNSFSPFSKHRCYIYQTLTGDIPINERIDLTLMNPYSYSRLSTHSPFSTGSTYLVFLKNWDYPNTSIGYHSLQYVGATIRISPFGNEKIPKGRSTMEQIQFLVTAAKVYWTEQSRREFEFYDMIMADNQPNRSRQ